MNARRAARELIIIVLSQVKLKKINDVNIDEILLNSVRTLVNDAEEDLKTTVTSLIEMKNFVDNYEIEHETNIKRPIDSQNLPVPIPMTSDMSGRIDCLIDVVEKSFKALEAAEIAVLEESEQVKKYTKSILARISENLEIVDKNIEKYSIGWEIDRILNLDKNILRMAIAELLYSNDVPVKVIIDEAVEIAKKYSTEESSAFINGILGKVVDGNKIKRKK